jgi:hypothetical protein
VKLYSHIELRAKTESRRGGKAEKQRLEANRTLDKGEGRRCLCLRNCAPVLTRPTLPPLPPTPSQLDKHGRPNEATPKEYLRSLPDFVATNGGAAGAVPSAAG